MRKLTLFVLIVALAACESGPQPTENSDEIPAAVEPEMEEGAAARPIPKLEPFLEEVEVDLGAESGDRVTIRDFAQDLAVVTIGAGKDRTYKLLRLKTLEVTPLPAFAGDTSVEPSFLGTSDGVFAIAEFEYPDKNEVRFELFRLETMRWELADKLKLPEPKKPAQPGMQSPQTSMVIYGERFRVWIRDGEKTVETHELNTNTMTWSKFEEQSLEENACFLPCRVGEDVIRWGGDPATKDLACVSVRASESDPWKRIETDDPTIMRSCRRLDENRILVTGGLAKMALFPSFNQNADIVEIDEARIRPLGEVGILGQPVEIPGDDLVWMKPGEIVRFDPKTETFEKSEGPTFDGKVGKVFTIDERTLLGVAHDKESTRFVRFGFR